MRFGIPHARVAAAAVLEEDLVAKGLGALALVGIGPAVGGRFVSAELRGGAGQQLQRFLDRAVDLACHEGYPGHHVFNMLLEKNLVRGRGWMEFSVYPLFSPQSLIAEGSANYGVDLAFPGKERIAFERDTLFPLAGLDPAGADTYYEALELVGRLDYAGNEAARRYLGGEMTAEEAAGWLAKFALHSPARARQRIRFIDQYRSYVINYNLGKDLVRNYVQARGGDRMEKKWDAFARLLSNPTLPSDLLQEATWPATSTKSPN